MWLIIHVQSYNKHNACSIAMSSCLMHKNNYSYDIHGLLALTHMPCLENLTVQYPEHDTMVTWCCIQQFMYG